VSRMDFSGAVWRKSSRSGGGNNGNCVEVARRAGLIGVRDSKNTAGEHLVFGEAAWREFAARLG
jgi:hypothetical protein